MKKTRTFILALLSLLTFAQAHSQCTLACKADMNVSLDPSGNATLTPENVLDFYGPSCGTLTLTPSSFDCSDIGSPVYYTVTDDATGNLCYGNIHVRYVVSVMACYGSINIALPASGTALLDGNLILVDPPADCVPGLIINPASVSCADIGTPVTVTVTDPDSGNSCWSEITVRDPRPESCEIIAPAIINCGESGVMLSANVLGGLGPFDYDWKIKGNPNGWTIVSGLGSDNITMDVGDKKIKLELTVTDVCDKKVKCSVKLECSDPAPMSGFERSAIASLNKEDVAPAINVFPNPASEVLRVNYAGLTTSSADQMYIVDQLGRRQLFTVNGQDRIGEITIDIQRLQPGVYWLILDDAGNDSVIRKFVKL